MKVLRLGPGDVAKLLPAKGLFDERPSARALRSYVRDPRNVLLLATEGDLPLGFLRGTALRQIRTERPQMFLYEIGVARRHRRRGVGRALIEALVQFCRTRGFDEIFVLTNPRNAPAVGLYRSTGAKPETSADRLYVYRLANRPTRSRTRRTRAGSRRGRDQASE